VMAEPNGRPKRVTRHSDLEVYRRAFNAAMRLFEVSSIFPVEERYSLTDHLFLNSPLPGGEGPGVRV
jgi:hypothetical protein